MNYLKQIKENLIINPTSGKETIAQSKDFYYIDSDFKNWGCNVSSIDTKECSTDLYELSKDGTYKEIYESLDVPLDKLCMTQGQILEWVKTHKNDLSDYYTHFLFKIGSDFFVAYVYVGSGGQLYASVDRFSDDIVWSAEGRYRFVTLQLDTEIFGNETLSTSDPLALALKIVLDSGEYVVYKKIK